MLESLGCAVTRASNPNDGKLTVRTRSGRDLEVFVATQRLGGYVFWLKRRLVPSVDRLAAIVLLGDAPEPTVFLIPSTEWVTARPPLTDRDYVGKKSEPEYGVEIGRAALPSLQRYVWRDSVAGKVFV